MKTFSKALARVLALVALVTFVAIAPASAVSPQTYEKQILKSTNDYRTAKGLKAVKAQACVDRWATGQAAWMAQTGRFEHRPGRLMKIIRDCKLTAASENIAWNYSSGTKTVKAWAHSPGHAKNMSARKMRYIGIGVVRAKNGQVYVSQVFGTRK